MRAGNSPTTVAMSDCFPTIDYQDQNSSRAKGQAKIFDNKIFLHVQIQLKMQQRKFTARLTFVNEP
jgi:hypothetical protein